MNTKHILIGSVAFVVMTSNVHARSFGNDTIEQESSMGLANRQSKCMLYKMSINGSSGFFGNSKSIEATCQDAGGEDFKFSANNRYYKDLVKYAAQEVIIVTGPNKSDNKVDDAKTDNILISIKPVNDTEIHEQKICGPDDPNDINYDIKPSKIYSSGYRVARPVSFDKIKNKWYMNSYVGVIDDTEWKSKGKGSNVTFTKSCAMAVNSIILTNTPLIFDYMQTKEEGEYTIGRVATIE